MEPYLPEQQGEIDRLKALLREAVYTGDTAIDEGHLNLWTPLTKRIAAALGETAP